MPPKKAAEVKPAADKTADKPSPAAAKKGAEKPVDKPTEKAAVTSSTTSTSTTSTTSQQPAKKQISSDPHEAAIQKRLDEIDAEIATHNQTLNNIRGGFDSTQKETEGVFEELRSLRNAKKQHFEDNNKSWDAIGKLIDEAKKMDTALKLKEEELKNLREESKFYSVKGQTPEGFLIEVDNRIKQLEAKQREQSVSLKEEKNTNSELVTLRKQRQNYKVYYEKEQIYKKDRSALKEFRDSINEKKKVHDENKAAAKEVKEKCDALDASVKASRSTLDGFSAERTNARDAIEKLKKEQLEKKQELRDYRDKQRQEKREEMLAEREERNRIRQEQDDKRREAEDKRIEEELKQDAFSSEVAVIEQLIKYLTPFIPKAPKPAAPAAAGSPTPSASTGSPAAAPAKDAAAPAAAKPAAAATTAPLRDNGPTGIALVKNKEDDSIPLSKRNKKKKEKVEKEKELKMNLQVVLQFESVSLTPPAKSSDVERSITQLREKKSYYQKKAIDERNKRLEDFKAKKTQRGQQAAAEAAVDASELPSSSDSSTTTTASTSDATTSAASPVAVEDS